MQVIFGINPVKEALLNDRESVEKIIIAKGKEARPVQSVLELASQNNVPLEFKDKAYVEKIAGGQVHQGVIALCRDFNYADFDKVVANRNQAFKYGLILIVDGVTDPQNLGSLIRTAHCLGANGLIIPEHRSTHITATVIKSSVGSVYHIPVAKVVNIANAIDNLKEKGYWVYGTEGSTGNMLSSIAWEGNVALVVGSEGKGIRPLVRKKCDFMVSIPMLGKIDSLNVSVAAGIIIFDILRKWGYS